MRVSEKLARVLAVLGACALGACVGGGGALPDGDRGWEPAGSFEGASQSERAPSSEEGVLRSGEVGGDTSERPPGKPSPQGGGAGGGDCSGVYACRESGDDKTTTVTLTREGGGCSFGKILLEADGTISRDGKKLGTWQLTGAGLVLETGGDEVTCTRASGTNGGSGASDDADDDDDPPKQGGAQPLPEVTRDAG